MITVVTSGGFDPLHAGHVQLINDARKLGDKLIVLLMSDKWLMMKKGYVFMPLDQREFIISNLRSVDEVIVVPELTTVVPYLRGIVPTIYAKGGDRNRANMPDEEVKACDELGIKIVDGVGGSKISSSSQLVRNSVRQMIDYVLKKEEEYRV